jgi:hypothetical protein
MYLIHRGILDTASTTDPAMEIPSAAVEARKASDTHSSKMQRIETNSEHDLDKAHVHESEVALILIGDGCREKGGTRELKVSGDVHSPHMKT